MVDDDSGPLVELFDPKDIRHEACVMTLKSIQEPIFTTVSVLTEAFHMLGPESRGLDGLRQFIMKGGLTLWFLNQTALVRAFELMEVYADHPMDLADASIIVAAESLATRRVFMIDRADFRTYRIRRGHRHYPVEILP